ncbi:MAG: phosphoenolpyruvate carboxylase, partial [Bacteriovoracaceae bacterium]|nr:phosphoenolpyruvate carboxylase [Bacteriovoracaceae bacterium]
METIPKDLQRLVYWAIELLGDSIKNQYGGSVYKLVEKTRRDMKSIRAVSHKEAIKVLEKNKKIISNLDTEQLKQIAHSFSLMLELINRCESAYRHQRLEGMSHQSFKQLPHAVIFVFTAHPTEARSPEILSLFQKIYELLIQALEEGFEGVKDKLKYCLDLSLNVSMARSAKPSVEDEACHLYSYVLRDEILSNQIKFAKNDIVVNFRSWVGGDKDGHPGVNSKTMIASLNYSRNRLLDFIEKRLNSALEDIRFLGQVPKEKLELVNLISSLKALRKITRDDGSRIVEFKKRLEQTKSTIESKGVLFPDLEDVTRLLWLYPAIVMPLEIREDSELVHEALDDPKLAICGMLSKIEEISRGYKAKWYARGFILSMCESSEDLSAGLSLVKKVFGGYRIPVVPLFETAKSLSESVQILGEYFSKHKSIKKEHQKHMNERFEVMLGYSDSSKESGVFPSRYLISRALRRLDVYFKKEQLTPVFFHGSGGSVERGGGSIKEQMQWWPKSAVNIFKATTQGEMIARNFQSDRIMSSQVHKIVESLNSKGSNTGFEARLLNKLCANVQKRYKELVLDEDFRKNILASTPYSYLDALKIGSRPSKRQTESQKLRAIPWVLCWTQTRVLLP